MLLSKVSTTRQVAKLAPLVALVFMLSPPIFPQALAEVGSLKITMEQYQWTEDMKRLKITTPETGLTLVISFSNAHDKYWVKLTKPEVTTEAKYLEEGSFVFRDVWSATSLYLPPKTEIKTYVQVDFKSAIYRPDKSIIGKWKISVSYKIDRQEWVDVRGMTASGSGLYIDNTGKLEPYPLEIAILSLEAFEKELKQGQQRPLIDIKPTINIELAVFGGSALSISIILIYLYLSKRRRK